MAADSLWVARPEELAVHFSGMPGRYWEHTDEPGLRWHLEIVHDFITTLTSTDTPATTPVIRWRQISEHGDTEVVVCTWDRQGLLATIAGSFAEVGLNIARADVYTRADTVVLDVFETNVPDPARLELMTKLLEANLRTATTPLLRPRGPRHQPNGSTLVVTFDNHGPPDATLLYVEAPDRLGLLHSILTVLTACAVNIVHAAVATHGNRATDVFYITDPEGRKLLDPLRLEHIRRALHDALG